MRMRAFLAALLLSATPALAQTVVVNSFSVPLATTLGGTGAASLTGLITNADLAGSIAASKLVGSDIATVGTITAGRWSSSGVLDTTSLAIGPGALNAQTGAGPYYNTASGTNALYSNTTGNSNTASGFQALFSNTTGNYNTASGLQALYSNTTGNYNTGSGFQALYSNTTGNSNTASGFQALHSNTTGNYNTGSGFQALYDNGAAQTAGAFNVGTSYTILTIGTTDFTLIGASSNTVGVVFTASGVGAGTGTATPNTNSNTALGYNTGRGITYGSNNTILGANVTGLAAGLSDAIILATGEGTIQADFGKTSTVSWVFPTPIKTGGYTVAALPASPGTGARAYVTDQSVACTAAGAALTGSGAVTCPVFYNGSAWVGD